MTKNQFRIAKILVRCNIDERKAIITILNSHFDRPSQIAGSALKVLEDRAMMKWIGEPLLEKDRLNQVLSLCVKIGHEIDHIKSALGKKAQNLPTELLNGIIAKMV